MSLRQMCVMLFVLGLTLRTKQSASGISYRLIAELKTFCNTCVPCDGDRRADNARFFHYLSKSSYREYVQIELDMQLNGFETLNSTIPTVLVAHGAFSSPNEAMGQQIRQAFADLRGKKKLAYNLIFIDWEALSKPCDCGTNGSDCYLYYGNTRGNVPRVAEQTALLLNTLVKLKKTTWDQTIYIGHSLATHIPNFMKPKLENGTLHQLYALDPAGPCFWKESDDLKLDATDADFVSVIHTDIILGTYVSIGHANFYPNGGHSQPGCDTDTEDTGRCEHSRAYQFFAESIPNFLTFPALSCDSWNKFLAGDCNGNDVNYMGWNSKQPRQQHVNYYLEVNDQSPYSKE